MKRILAIILTVLMLVSVLPISALAATVEEQAPVVTQESIQYTCDEEEFKEIISESPQSEASLEQFLNGVNIHSRGYYYTYLADSFEKQVYDASYNNFSPSKTEVKITTSVMNGLVYYRSTDAGYETSAYLKAWKNYSTKAMKAMWCYRYDNVEDCDSYTSSTSCSARFSLDSSGKITSTELTLILENHTYYNSSLITQRDARIREIAAIAAQKTTPYEKMKAIHDELALSAEYDYRTEALNSQYRDTQIFYYAHSSLGILVKNLGVCEGYAKAFKMVCDYMGLPTTICIISETHMWNIVLINDEWYCVDVTWDDAGGSNVNYNYFLCGDPDIVDGSSTDHVPKLTYTVAPKYASQKFSSTSCIHEKVAMADVPSTCTSYGSTGGIKCKYCGKIFEQPTATAKKAHTPVYVSALAPTYEADGYKSHYKCSVCYNIFSDAAGNTPITYESIRLPQLTEDYTCNHTFDVIIPAIPATTENCGMTEGLKCSWCDTYEIVPMEIPRIASIKLSKDKYTYTGKAIKPGVVVTDEMGQVIPSSNYTLKYSSGLKLPGTYSVTVTFKGNYSGTHKYNFKIVIPNPAPKASSSTSAVKLSWGKVSGASGYLIYDANKKKIKDNKTATSYTISKRSAGKTYTYYVRTYKKISGKTYASDYVKVTTSTLPSAPKVTPSSNASVIKYTWGKVSGASGYVVYNGSKGVIKDCGNTTTYTLSGRKSGTSYSVYMRAYRTVEGKRYYSSYVKVSYSTKPANPAVKYSASTSSVKLLWGKVTGASGYIVYNSAKKKLSDRKTSTSYSISKLKSATNYTYYVRAYRKALGKTFYSDYIKVTATTLPATPTVVSVGSNTTEIKVTWKKVSGASGYEFYNADKSFLWEGNSSYTSLKIYDCQVGTKYTYYMRAFKTVSGKRVYSGYRTITYATKPKFSSSSVTVGVGTKQKLSLQTTASSVTWSSSNKTIATVDSAGNVTGKKAGTVTITAVANGQKATITVYVKKVNISLNKTSITLSPYYSTTISAKVVADGNIETLYWDSSNWDVAEIEIDDDNVVHIIGKQEGTATITAYFTYGGVKYSATCKVTVKIPTYSSYGFSDVPDLAGAVGGSLKPKDIVYKTKETEFLYSSYDVNWDGKCDLSFEIYRDYLQMKGFSYVTTQNGSYGEWTCKIELYQNESTGRIVLFMLWSDGDVSVVISK